MGIKHDVFEFTSNTIIKGLRLNHANKFLCKFSEKVNPLHVAVRDGKKYTFYCPNELTRWRAETHFTKEPETIEWMDTFKKGDVLFDIGANVGMYTVYAAKAGVKVVAFEPESQNYALLNKNLYLNDLAEQVVSLNVALSDKDGMDFLFLPYFQAGGALNNLGEAVDFQHRTFKACYKQAVLAYSLDSFLAMHTDYFPTHIKIDVDGLESRIIKGAEKTLRDSRVRSLLIEINEVLPEDLKTAKRIESFGLKLLHKKHSDMAAQGDFKTIFNYIYTR